MQHFQSIREASLISIEVEEQHYIGQTGPKKKQMFIDVIQEINEKTDSQVTITDGPSRPGVWRVEANAFVIHPDVFIEKE